MRANLNYAMSNFQANRAKKIKERANKISSQGTSKIPSVSKKGGAVKSKKK